MSNNQRLGYQRLAEVLVERGLVEPQSIQDALSMGAHGGLPFPEALVTANLVADWELSRVVCELYGLPFLTVDMVEPSPDAMHGLDRDFLRDNGLIPLSRHGQVLTVCMPSVVPADILGCLAAESDCVIMPVVGTVQTNRRWLNNKLEAESALVSDAASLEDDSGEWANFLDEADAAVLSEIDDGFTVEPAESIDEMQAVEDLGGVEDLGELEILEPTKELSAEPPAAKPALKGKKSRGKSNKSGKSPQKKKLKDTSNVDLPPPPPPLPSEAKSSDDSEELQDSELPETHD